jgi:hypothetical protein
MSTAFAIVSSWNNTTNRRHSLLFYTTAMLVYHQHMGIQQERPVRAPFKQAGNPNP